MGSEVRRRCSRHPALFPKLLSSTWAGLSSHRRGQRYFYVYFWRRNLLPAPPLFFWLRPCLVQVPKLRIKLMPQQQSETKPNPQPAVPQENSYTVVSAPPLFLGSLLSLISNCLNPPFGIREGPKRLREACFLQTKRFLPGRAP